MFHLWTNQPVSAWLVLFFVVVFVIVSFLFVCLFGGCESLCWIACLFETRFAVYLWLALYSAILLSQPLKCWDYVGTSPHPTLTGDCWRDGSVPD